MNLFFISPILEQLENLFFSHTDFPIEPLKLSGFTQLSIHSLKFTLRYPSPICLQKTTKCLQFVHLHQKERVLPLGYLVFCCSVK